MFIIIHQFSEYEDKYNYATFHDVSKSKKKK